MSTTVLVTGGAGFIGSHLVDALIARGDTVVVADNLSTGSKTNVHPKARLEIVDVASKEFDELFAAVRPSLVFHLAAQMSIVRSVQDPVHDAQVNILGGIRVLRCCVRHKTERIVIASSGGAIYSDQGPFPATEMNPEQPRSPYGIAKLTVDRYLDFFVATTGLSAVTLRFSNVYGPRQTGSGEAGVIAIFCHHLLHGDAPVIYGTGGQTRDYLYVDDAVAAFLAALDPIASGMYNVGTARETSVNVLLTQLLEVARLQQIPAHAAVRPWEMMRSALSGEKLQRATAWQPRMELMEGLRHTMQWFQGQIV